ncbi:MAG: hypothetical protein JJU02_06870 [Cryomorphaceae bacterium]|nr:hypothetical protein [Cryomorphaceae bacterium]
MKKLTLLLLSFVVMMACRREGPPGPPGPAGPGAKFTILDVTVQPSDWQPFGNPEETDFQYYASFGAPEITQQVFNNSLVIGYFIDNGVAFILPNTINQGDYITEFSMIHAVGVIDFIVKDSDLETEPPNYPIDFRVYIVDGSARVNGMEDWSMEEIEEYHEKMMAE